MRDRPARILLLIDTRLNWNQRAGLSLLARDSQRSERHQEFAYDYYPSSSKAAGGALRITAHSGNPRQVVQEVTQRMAEELGVELQYRVAFNTAR
jgi:hypothetical protein